MLTPARHSTATASSLTHAKAHGSAFPSQARRRTDGPETIQGPHFHRAAGDAARQPDANAQLPADSRLGFLAVCETPDNAFVGGYLMTNLWGRPLEFQCTAPVRPNRAQEILFGPTLRCVLFGELIGATLIEKSSSAPALVLTDQRDVLSARPRVNVPIVCLHRPPPSAPDASDDADAVRTGDNEQIAASATESMRAHCFARFEHDTLALDALLRSGERVQDLHEPFQRIHLCIEEVCP